VSGGVAAPATSITSIARYPQHLDVFCVGSDNGIYSSWWDISTATAGWANWFRVAGGVAAPGTTITVVARNPNHLDLFAVGSDMKIYSIWWDANGGGWANWFQIAGGVAAPNTSIAAIDRTPTHLDLFAVGTDQRIYSIWWDASGGWAGSWFNVSGGVAAPGTSISVVARYPTHLDVFAVGSDHGIYSTWWDASSGWANWFQIAGGVAAPNTSVNALARYPDHLDVFAVGTDLHVDTTWWEDEMYFSMQPQQQSNWCWAATATSVALFYQPASTWTQCLVANNQTGRSDCCGSGGPGPCNVDGYLNSALSAVGHLDQMVGGVATVPQIETEVTYARPLGIRVAWSGGGAHFLCIMGQYSAGGTDYVTVDDPIYGRSNVSYAALQTAYQSIGTWTHTYYTRY
jgi:hypothetical protein